MPVFAILAAVMAFAPVCAGSETISDFSFVSGNVKCCMTWTGERTGWRLLSADTEGKFSTDGAVQRLSRFLGEAVPPYGAEFYVSRKSSGQEGFPARSGERDISDPG